MSCLKYQPARHVHLKLNIGLRSQHVALPKIFKNDLYHVCSTLAVQFTLAYLLLCLDLSARLLCFQSKCLYWLILDFQKNITHATLNALYMHQWKATQTLSIYKRKYRISLHVTTGKIFIHFKNDIVIVVFEILAVHFVLNINSCYFLTKLIIICR